MKIKNKTIVITGAASGIGRAMAERFRKEGAAHLILADLNEDGADKVARNVGGRAVRVNVADEAEIKALIEDTEAREGPIDLFCSNAGIALGMGLESPNNEWQTSWDVNLMSHVYAARHLVPRMVARGGGYLLNTASAAGLLTSLGSATYSVTKHGAVALAEWIAITHGDQGIKVSVLCPQAVNTAMTAQGAGAAAVDGMIEPDVAVEAVVQALEEERFLVLTHPEVAEYIKRKATNYDRWLNGMRRLQARFHGPS